MTIQEALDVLRRGATRRHGILWELSGGGAGEPGGVPVVARACSCVRHSLTTADPPSDDLPCDCGAREWNAKVEEAVNTLVGVINEADDLYWNSDLQPCLCREYGSAMDGCPYCLAQWKAHCLLNGWDADEMPPGN